MSARRLDIGAGHLPFAPNDPEWETADWLPSANPTHLVDVTAPLPFDDETFDELRASDVLEHVSFRDTLTVLTEWARIAKPGAPLFVMVPDAEVCMTGYASNPAGMVVPEFADYPPIVSVAWRLLGGHHDQRVSIGDDDWRSANVHLALFSMDSLRFYLDRAGWAVDDIARNAHPNLIARAHKR